MATMKLSEEKGKHQIVFGDSEINETQENKKEVKSSNSEYWSRLSLSLSLVGLIRTAKILLFI